jgi:hypothetical protein
MVLFIAISGRPSGIFVSGRDIPAIVLGTFAETLLVLFAIVDEAMLAGT